MRKVDLWEVDGLLDEAIERGVIASRKFWGKNVARAFVELSAFNFDRGYRYHLYSPVDDREQTSEVVKLALVISPGDPKFVGLLLYEKGEPSPLDTSWEPYDLEGLRRRIKDNEERVYSSAVRLVQERLGPDAKQRDTVAEYDLEIKYLVQQNDRKHVLWVLGSNYLADQIAENIPSDFSRVGMIAACWIPEARNTELTDIIEEQDLITAHVKLK